MLLVYFWLWWVFVAALAFFWLSWAGTTFHCSVWASPCSGFFCWGAQVLGRADFSSLQHMGSIVGVPGSVVVHGLCCSAAGGIFWDYQLVPVLPGLLWVWHWKSTSPDTLPPQLRPRRMEQCLILLMKNFFLAWRHSEDNRRLSSLGWQRIVSGRELPKTWSESRKRGMNLPGEQGREDHSRNDQQGPGGDSIWVKQRSKEQQEDRREEVERLLILEPDFLVTKQQVTHMFIGKS